jgi:hypothetical protein
MKLKTKTLEKIKEIEEHNDCSSKGQAVATSVNIAHYMINEIKKGNQILIEHKDGHTERIVFS